MKILDEKNIISEIKDSVNTLGIKIEMTEKRISGLVDQQKFSNLKNKEKKDFK